jgi:hypothetical protein
MTTDVRSDSMMDTAVIHEPLPVRARRRLLAPAPLALLGVLVAACGFIGGVLVQKGQQGGTSAFPQGLPNFAAARAGQGAGAAPGASAAGGNSTTGDVSSINGRTLYVSTGQGGTTAVKLPSSATITRTAEAGAAKIRPGDTVVVQGTQAANGTVKASSVTATASGAQSGNDAVGALFQGGAQ